MDHPRAQIEQALADIGQGLTWTFTYIVCLAFAFEVVRLGSWLADRLVLPHLQIISAISTAIIWTILPPTCGWRRADLTQGEFISSLKHMESSPDDCIICFDTCKTPVQLPCGHIECESCLCLLIAHNYESCSLCGKKFTGHWFIASGDRWSILISKVVMCIASCTIMTGIHNLPHTPGDPSSSELFRIWLMLPILYLNTFVATAFRGVLRDEHSWWCDLDAFHPVKILEWAFYLAITFFLVY